MKNTIITLLFVIFHTILLAGNFYPVKIIYKNGKEEQGFAKDFKNAADKIIQFKINENSEVQKIVSDKIKTIIYYKGDNIFEFDRMKTCKHFPKGSINKPIWLKVVTRGIVSLYYYEIGDYVSLDGGYIPRKGYWLCHRDGEPAAFLISKDFSERKTYNRIFKHEGQKYFSIYADLALKIKNKTYKWDDLNRVVDIYNEWAEMQKKIN